MTEATSNVVTLSCGHGGRLRRLEACRDADVLVLTAGVPFRPGRRLDLAVGSVAICRDLLPRLPEAAPGAVLVVVTNPVDVVTYAARKIGGLPRHRVHKLGL